MLSKEQIKKAIDNIPDGFTVEDVIEAIVLIDKIEQGRKDVAEGRVLTDDEVKNQLPCIS